MDKDTFHTLGLIIPNIFFLKNYFGQGRTGPVQVHWTAIVNWSFVRIIYNLALHYLKK